MLLEINKEWTLFLDRDGVINQRIPNDYVKTIDQFKFIDGTLEAIAVLSKAFGKIIIVSNQQGIGKGLMTIDEVNIVHDYMISEVNKAGGKVDHIFVSPHLHSEKHFTRKPSVGMGILARKMYRDISFRKSIMVGDSISDLIFGKRLGMITIFIGNPSTLRTKPGLADYSYVDLLSFANKIK